MGDTIFNKPVLMAAFFFKNYMDSQMSCQNAPPRLILCCSQPVLQRFHYAQD